MGKECWTWVSRSLWEGGNTTPLRTSAWEAKTRSANKENKLRIIISRESEVNKSVGICLAFGSHENRKPSKELMAAVKPESKLTPK